MGVFTIQIDAQLARLDYWDYILDMDVDIPHWDNIDGYILEHYADELKKPEVIARILGSKSII